MSFVFGFAVECVKFTNWQSNAFVLHSLCLCSLHGLLIEFSSIFVVVKFCFNYKVVTCNLNLLNIQCLIMNLDYAALIKPQLKHSNIFLEKMCAPPIDYGLESICNYWIRCDLPWNDF